MPGTLEGPNVRLLDVTTADIDLLTSLRTTQAGGFNDFGVPPKPIPADRWLDGRMRTDSRAEFFVERRSDRRIVGTIGYHRVAYGANPESGAWMIGIDLAPEGRGQGLGTEAQRLLAAWLFDTTDANRVEASTDVENIAEARALEKAGFTREGVSRGAQFRAGSYHDLVVYSKLRSDPR
ncbi:MAG TPA: GNAT family protein [Candidatus Limnocylindria bacterium]|nr:GNAT family protein [Candidatus Limnocylindria bacterium]